MDRMHSENAPGDHCFVIVMGVHSEHQGKRSCLSLMRFVNYLAGRPMRSEGKQGHGKQGAEINTALTRPVQAKED